MPVVAFVSLASPAVHGRALVPAFRGGLAEPAMSKARTKAAELSDYSVGITALVTKDEIYILDIVRERLEYPALKRRIITEKQRWKARSSLSKTKAQEPVLSRTSRGMASTALPSNPKATRWSASAPAPRD